MSIQVIRNRDGNCIEFRGSSTPVYWNGILQAEIDPTYPNTINVINTAATLGDEPDRYELFQIKYTQFSDEDGNAFANPQAVVDYINAAGNVFAGQDIPQYSNTIEFNNVPEVTIDYSDETELQYGTHPTFTVFTLDALGNPHETFPQIEYNVPAKKVILRFGTDYVSGYVVLSH